MGWRRETGLTELDVLPDDADLQPGPEIEYSLKAGCGLWSGHCTDWTDKQDCSTASVLILTVTTNRSSFLHIYCV